MWTTTSKLTQLENGWLVEIIHEWVMTSMRNVQDELKPPFISHRCFLKRQDALDYITSQLVYLDPLQEEKEQALLKKLEEDFE